MFCTVTDADLPEAMYYFFRGALIAVLKVLIAASVVLLAIYKIHTHRLDYCGNL